MSKGWILLHRQLLDCSLWLSDEPFDRRSAWIDLLLLVNHNDKQIIFNGKQITIKRGQYLTSIRKLSEKWNWSRDRVTRYLLLLEELEMITRESDRFRTLITIEKYDVYQVLSDTNKDTDKDTNKDTNKDTDKDTNKAQTNNVNNVNNLTNKCRTFKKPTLEDVKAYCIERDNNVDAERFIDYYTANGWKVGKNSMKDWKATVRNWEKGDRKNGTNKQHSNRTVAEDDAFEQELESEIRRLLDEGERLP